MTPARVAVIDLGLGNVGSVINMLKKAGARAEAVLEPPRLAEFDRLVLPGVGAFDRGMERLDDAGWRPALEREVVACGKPILGICLGLQLFCKSSEEGVRPGLGWLDARVVRFRPASSDGRPLRVPHMGWNEVSVASRDPLFAGEASPGHAAGAPRWKFYFLHSYHVQMTQSPMTQAAEAALVQATCRYGDVFPCALRSGNVMGVQFHPEKSHAYGLRFLKNFVEAQF